MSAVELHTVTRNGERHGEIAGEWLASFASEHTARAYRRDLRDFFVFLDSGDVDALAAARRHVDLYRHTLTGAPSSRARKLAAVSSFYSYAMDTGVLPANPARLVRRPRVDTDHSSTQGLTKDQAREFLVAAQQDGPRSHAIAALLIFTGIRISEALSALHSDIQHDAGHRVLVVTRKGGKRQKIVLPAPVLEALAAYLGSSATQGTEIATADAVSANAPLFTTSTGKPWSQSEAFRTVQRLARVAGIDGHVSPHSLRHTHATLALDAGVQLADLQDSMGHADPRTTRRYDRARGRLERSSAYALAAVLS
jgi:site-specific recombinase XerD